MFIYVFSFLTIIMLILTNAITDAPNAICTLVGTKVMSFKKAARMSAVFNLIGIIVMSFINISVADCISSMINLTDGSKGILGLTSAIIAVIVFAFIAMYFGIPTSETHGLVAGLTGSAIALYSFDSINWNEWKNVVIGLVWSILGTFIISYIISKIFSKLIDKFSRENIEKAQVIGTCGMSFMHGAQDGQKFIGVLIIFFSILKNINIPEQINPINYLWIIIFTAIVMAIGVSIGGKKIVDNVGSQMVNLNNKQALLSDVTTIVTLFFASINGLPISTTHVKTISIIGIGKSMKTKINSIKFSNIIKAWIWTFPICGALSYILSKTFEIFFI